MSSLKQTKEIDSIMIQGTGSGVGKSLITAALGRYFHRNGVKVAPFKAQNMALNSFVTADGLEMGRAQVFQAEACGLAPDIRMNPILLKPNADHQSQVILMGRAMGNMDAREYYTHFNDHRKIARQAYDSLASEYDLMLIEGAGSPAEINLQDTDIVNMSMAEHAQAAVVIVSDIDRGGAFAWMKGTFDLLPDSHKALVKGFIINKFRGDKSLLDPGIRMFEDMTGRPVLGVLPYQDDIFIDEEDSLALQQPVHYSRKGGITIGVVPAPHISNFTDFTPLGLEEDVSLLFLKEPNEADRCHSLILPGTKSVVSDALALSDAGWFDAVRSFHASGRQVAGLCGGFQMLGESIADPLCLEGEIKSARGIGLLPIRTEITGEKKLKQVSFRVSGNGFSAAGPNEGFKAEVAGYEIHMGRTEIVGDVKVIFEDEDPATGCSSPDHSVFGAYMHGLFDSDSFRRSFINKLRCQRGLPPLPASLNYREFRLGQLDRLGDLVERCLDMDKVCKD